MTAGPSLAARLRDVLSEALLPEVQIDYLSKRLETLLSSLLEEREREIRVKFDVMEAMIRYGGSFVQQLGQLYRLADEINRLKLHREYNEAVIRRDRKRKGVRNG